jgi:replicative DNA helicase
LVADRPGKAPAIAKDEGYLLGLVMGRPELMDQLASELASIEFLSPVYADLFHRLGELHSANPSADPVERFEAFAPEEQRLLARAAMAHYPELEGGSEEALAQSLAQCIQTLKINACQRRLKVIEADLRAARASGDESRLVTLMEEHDRLAHQRDALKDMRYGPS